MARSLGLSGLAADIDAGPRFELNLETDAAEDWFSLVGDGTVRRMTLDVGRVNTAFAQMEDERAARRALTEPDDETFINLYTALVSHPPIRRALLSEAEYANLEA